VTSAVSADYTAGDTEPTDSLRTQVSRGVRWGVPCASVAGLLWPGDLRDQLDFARLVVNGRARR
jgi:hypothetical protein